MSSLQSLKRKVTAEAATRLQSILLLQMLVGLSQTLNGGVAQSRMLARTLLLDGQQRLRKLLAAAPRLNLPLEQVLEICRSGDADESDPTPEESAVRAFFEMCLGLMLHWLNKNKHEYTIVPSTKPLTLFPRDSSSPYLTLIHPLRTRAWPIHRN